MSKTTNASTATTAATTGDALVTVREAEAALRVCRTNITKLRASGALVTVKIGKAVRIRRSSIDKLISQGGVQ